jgi:hypothetical protein
MASNYTWTFTTENLSPPQNCTLLILKKSTGSGTVTGMGINCGADCSETYSLGTSVTLTATPAENSTFKGWSGGGCYGTGICTVTLYSDELVTANFDIKSYTITASAESHGAITPSGSVVVNHGANQSFTMAGDAGYRVQDVSVDSVSVGAVNTYTFTNVTANHSITATFTNETISVPTIPSGSDRGVKGISYTYATGGSLSSLDHPVEYRIDWGDGTYSDWSSSGSFKKIWSVSGMYTIKAQARCALCNTIVSEWSEGSTVTIQDECSTWDDVAALMLAHENGEASWDDVVKCYTEYTY